jgi:hypothetical protein
MTDDAGNLLLDDNEEKIPRLSYDLRKYATDPNGPVQAKETVVLFWTPAQLVKEILDAEKEAGIIVSPQEKKKLEKGAGSAQNKEDNVPKMNIKKGSIGGGAKPAGIRFPATGKKVEAAEEATETDEAPADEGGDSNGFRAKRGGGGPKLSGGKGKGGGKAKSGNGEAAPSSPGLTAEQLVEAFGPIMAEVAEEAANKAVAAYAQGLDDMKNAILTAVKENQDVVIGGITVLHDVLAPVVTGDDERQLIAQGADILVYLEGDEGNGG